MSFQDGHGNTPKTTPTLDRGASVDAGDDDDHDAGDAHDVCDDYDDELGESI